MIVKKIKNLLDERKWTFADFQNMQGIIDEFNLELQDTMTKVEKLDFIFNKHIFGHGSNTVIPDRWEFQDIFTRTVSEHLDITIANVLKVELMNANINFKKEEKTNVSKRSVGRKSSKKRTTNEKTDSEE